jgi:hypothetical protein
VHIEAFGRLQRLRRGFAGLPPDGAAKEPPLDEAVEPQATIGQFGQSFGCQVELDRELLHERWVGRLPRGLLDPVSARRVVLVRGALVRCRPRWNLSGRASTANRMVRPLIRGVLYLPGPETMRNE